MRWKLTAVVIIFFFTWQPVTQCQSDLLRPAATKERKRGVAEKGGSQTPLEQYLRDPVVTGTKGIRARFLTLAAGGTRSYDALVLDGFSHNLLPELKEGLSPLLARFEQESAARGTGWSWLDLATGLATAPKQAMKIYPHMKPILVDAVLWSRSDFLPEDATDAEQKAAELRIPNVWSMEGLDFIQQDVGQAVIPKSKQYPIHIATMFQALSYNKDPLRILAHVYNQLPVEAYLVVNFYIPTEYNATKLGIPPEYSEPEGLVQFWKNVFRNLQTHGVPVDLLVKDLRVQDTPAQGYKDRFFPEFHLGIVIQRVPIKFDVRLAAHAVPVQIVGARLVEYQFAWYEGNLLEPFAYEYSANLDEIDKAEKASSVTLKQL